MTEILRVALVGAGIQSLHLVGYGWRPELFDVRVLCSLDADRGSALCEKHAIPEFTESFDSPHRCASCGAAHPRWVERCPSCRNWNTSRP